VQTLSWRTKRHRSPSHGVSQSPTCSANSAPPPSSHTQLVHVWTKQPADGESLANRRRTIRDNTINQGCPHVALAVEIVFVTNSFVAWLKESESRND
jgi:hypothetical protein